MYVETDFLLALAKPSDWLQNRALAALDEHTDIHTSIATYAELFLYAYDEDASDYRFDLPRAITNLVTYVPVRPERHEDAVLTAAVLADEQGLTPFDAIHAGIAIATDEPICTSEGAYDDLGVERIPLEPSD